MPTPVLIAEPLLGRMVKIANARSGESRATQHPAQRPNNEEQRRTDQRNDQLASWVQDQEHSEGEHAEQQQADAKDEC